MMSKRRTMSRERENHRELHHSSSPSTSKPTPLSSESEAEDEDVKDVKDVKMQRPRKTWTSKLAKKVLSKQLSLRDMEREAKWERRKRLMYLRSHSDWLVGEKDVNGKEEEEGTRSLTDEDLDELKGSLDLGFGFDEENGGRRLCKTLPALSLYFEVKRQLSNLKLRETQSAASTPTATTTSSSSPETAPPSPKSMKEQPQLEQGKNSVNADDETWRFFKPGDSPEQMKTKLRHWAQIVACTVRQGY